MKNRTFTEGQKVKIYYNLHKHCLSVVDKKTNRVIGYTDAIFLRDVCFKVSEKGRQRVLRKKRKNVHAYVEGTYQEHPMSFNANNFRIAYYNPYLTKKFMDTESGIELHC